MQIPSVALARLGLGSLANAGAHRLDARGGLDNAFGAHRLDARGRLDNVSRTIVECGHVDASLLYDLS